MDIIQLKWSDVIGQIHWIRFIHWILQWWHEVNVASSTPIDAAGDEYNSRSFCWRFRGLLRRKSRENSVIHRRFPTTGYHASICTGTPDCIWSSDRRRSDPPSQKAPSKHCSLDPAPTWLVKKSWCYHCAGYCNASFAQCTLPVSQKRAVTRPIIYRKRFGVRAYPPSRRRGGAHRLALVVWCETTAAMHVRWPLAADITWWSFCLKDKPSHLAIATSIFVPCERRSRRVLGNNLPWATSSGRSLDI